MNVHQKVRGGCYNSPPTRSAVQEGNIRLSFSNGWSAILQFTNEDVFIRTIPPAGTSNPWDEDYHDHAVTDEELVARLEQVRRRV